MSAAPENEEGLDEEPGLLPQALGLDVDGMLVIGDLRADQINAFDDSGWFEELYPELATEAEENEHDVLAAVAVLQAQMAQMMAMAGMLNGGVAAAYSSIMAQFLALPRPRSPPKPSPPRVDPYSSEMPDETFFRFTR